MQHFTHIKAYITNQKYCNKCFSRNDSLKWNQLKCCKKLEDNLYYILIK